MGDGIVGMALEASGYVCWQARKDRETSSHGRRVLGASMVSCFEIFSEKDRGLRVIEPSTKGDMLFVLPC